MLGPYVAVSVVDVRARIYLLIGRNHQVHVLGVIEVRISTKPLKGVHLGVECDVLGPDLDQLVVHVLVDELLDHGRQVLQLVLDPCQTLTIDDTCRWLSGRLLGLGELGVHLLLELVEEFVGAGLVGAHRVDVGDHLRTHPRPVLLKPLLNVLTKLGDLLIGCLSFFISGAAACLSARSLNELDLIEHISR